MAVGLQEHLKNYADHVHVPRTTVLRTLNSITLLRCSGYVVCGTVYTVTATET